MRKIGNKIAAFFLLPNEKGVTAVEYGMLAALIVLAIIGVITTLGTNLQGVFGGVSNQVKAP